MKYTFSNVTKIENDMIKYLAARRITPKLKVHKKIIVLNMSKTREKYFKHTHTHTQIKLNIISTILFNIIIL